MNNRLVYIKSLGKTRYTDYKCFLQTKTSDELIDIKANLYVQCSSLNQTVILLLGVVLLIFSLVFSKFSYDFVKNAYTNYPVNKANILIGSFLPFVSIVLLFLIFLFFIMYIGFKNAKRKVFFIETFEKESKK